MKLLEQVLSKENMHKAYKAVWKNQGSAGVDGMGLEDLLFHLAKHWEETKTRLLQGNYYPGPVLGISIDKENGGKRLLGIPTVVDRLVQQAIHQVLSPVWDKEFSDHSYADPEGTLEWLLNRHNPTLIPDMRIL